MKGKGHLFYLPRVALIGAGDIVGEGLRAGELVVRARGRNDVAVAGDLSGEAGDRAGNLKTKPVRRRSFERVPARYIVPIVLLSWRRRERGRGRRDPVYPATSA